MKWLPLYSLTWLLVLSASLADSQNLNRTRKWYYAGSPAPAVDFSPATPTPLFNSGITFSWESGSSLSDLAGNLLFYGDGNAVIFNRNHVQMANGGGVYMHNSVTQGCNFIPRPGSNNLYYMFHIGLPTLSGPPFNFYYSEIDMNLSGGLGSVTANKNVSLAASFGNCSEKLAITQHCNGTDYWVVVHDQSGNAFKAYAVTAAGVNTTPVVSNVGTPFVVVPNVTNDDIGQMKISPNGTKLAVILYSQNIVELFDFNRNTGVVSNPITLGGTGSQYPYGVEFSPDNSLLYVSGGGTPNALMQWNLCAGNAAAIAASGVTIANTSLHSLQLAPDWKIYGCAFNSSNLAVIASPNVVGAGCGYNANGINTTPKVNELGLPNFASTWFDDPANSAVTQSQVNAACGCTGSATAQICYSFGVGPFTYSWSNGTTDGPTTNLTSSISNLCAGNYSVIISDASCRQDTLTYNITGGGPGGITIGTNSVNPSCNQNNGSATVTATGGTPNYTYQWSNGQSTSAVTGLAAGTYTVLITDAAACTNTATFVLTSAAPTATLSATPTSCFGGTNGSVSVSASGGTPGYTYSWQPGGGTAASISNLGANIYTVTITDQNNCTTTDTVSVTQPAALMPGGGVTQGSCGSATGSATITVTGGTPGYSYSWSNGASTSAVSGLTGGTYSVTVTDNNGCTAIAVYSVSSSGSSITTTVASTSVSCNGGTNGTGGVTATNGTAPYTYQWQNSQTSSTATGLAAGTYTVLVTDASGCTATNSVTISQPASLAATITTIADTCNKGVGASSVNVNGGTAGYTYQWSNGQNGAAASGLTSGNYSVVITDANGCTTSANTTITNQGGTTANAGADQTIQSGNSATLVASGGVNYTWSNGQSGNTITVNPTVTTNYTVTVSDASGCSGTDVVTIYVEEPIFDCSTLPTSVFYLPNAFSPNGDGDNDEFKMHYGAYLVNCIESINIKIYNRWGELIFESDDPAFSWNGELRNKELNDGVYPYFMKLKLKTGKEFNEKGNVSLLTN